MGGEEMVDDMTPADGIEARLRMAAGLPEMLAAGFDAFEVIRLTARDWQDRATGLFGAFMTAADAAVDGREALTIAPSLPPDDGAGPRSAIAAGINPGQAADALAVIASALQNRLTAAAARGHLPADRAACQDAAAAAGRICQLMARGDP
jgi:hypothetical protein